MKTRIKLKGLRTYKDPDSNVFTIYITYSVRGRRDVATIVDMCELATRSLFPASIKPNIYPVGWGDDKCKTYVYAVQLIILGRIIGAWG